MPNNSNLLSKEKTQKQNRIWVRIASVCNNNCIFCLDSNAHDGTFSDEEEIKKNIKDGFKEGFNNRVIISGGEASINPKFSDYISYAKEVGYNRVQTITNGIMFASEDFCKKVFNAGLEEVTFSMHGHNETLHDYLVGTPGTFKKSLKGLLYIKKHFPNIIINIDIVVNKININYLPDIVKFYMKLGIYEFDILQIIPFGRGFHENRQKLFYKLEDYSNKLSETWKLSKIKGMYMWTNRFPAEAFENFEDLIQDPRKIKSEVMGEGRHHFEPFILSNGNEKQECFPAACDSCFLKQYCNDFIDNQKKKIIDDKQKYFILKGEEFPSNVYEKYGKNKEDFIGFLKNIDKPILNLPKCLGGTGIYETYNDIMEEKSIEDYTEKYINDLYRKKSLRCAECKYNDKCEGIHINFIRSYGFNILNPINNNG
ncbi:MAG: radical SAM protein [Candidatus Gracilibacteria bacterium]|nr:radical SAM protein [Candidatus Gracilibacteria bacterium]MDD2908592.1 radical SAM protein [Candidatus Gracilibacteria bacterium]